MPHAHISDPFPRWGHNYMVPVHYVVHGSDSLLMYMYSFNCHFLFPPVNVHHVAFQSFCTLLFLTPSFRARKAKYSYSCRSQQQKNGGYYPGGEVNLETWGESSTLPHDRARHSDYEMTENGSKQNLLAGGTGRVSINH